MSEKSLPHSNKHPIPSTMMSVVTTGNGGYDKLEYKRVPLPQLRTGEVLLKVLAAGMNNTEINTCVG
jgi:NADPH:quinone reductase-like Zn-dependent oxidoreductase